MTELDELGKTKPANMSACPVGNLVCRLLQSVTAITNTSPSKTPSVCLRPLYCGGRTLEIVQCSALIAVD